MKCGDLLYKQIALGKIDLLEDFLNSIYCLVLLQVPKCFSQSNFFGPEQKMELQLVLFQAVL